MEESHPDRWLAREPLPTDPAQITKRWLDEAFAARIQANPHAVALATVDPDGSPSVRMVLCNEIDADAATFTMYTNIESRKGRALPGSSIEEIPSRMQGLEGRTNVEKIVTLECTALAGERENGREITAAAQGWRFAGIEQPAHFAGLPEAPAHLRFLLLEEGLVRVRESQAALRRAASHAQLVYHPCPFEAFERCLRDQKTHPTSLEAR